MQLDLETYVPSLLLRLSNRVSSSASSLYNEKFGIGVTEWRILSYFKIYPWTTAASACELMGLDKGAVSRTISFMVENDWLESRPQGLRKVEYRVTLLGNKLHNSVYRMAMARQEALLHGFSTSERELIIELLKRMMSNLEGLQRVGR